MGSGELSCCDQLGDQFGSLQVQILKPTMPRRAGRNAAGDTEQCSTVSNNAKDADSKLAALLEELDVEGMHFVHALLSQVETPPNLSLIF